MSEQNIGIRINIERTGSGAEQASKDLDKATESAERLNQELDKASQNREIAPNNTNLRASLEDIRKGAEGAKSAVSEATKQTEKLGGAGKQASEGMREATRGIREAATSAKSSNGIFSNLASSFRRILKLRILRGIVRSVFSAFKEGTQNIYAYSQALNSADSNHFASTMDGLASALLKMKNTIGTAVAPLLSSLVPIIQKIVGWITAAIDAIAQFLAVLQGKSTYTRAKDVSVQWQNTADNLDNANASAKELKRTLLGFDEINALNAPDTGSGGGGGGGGDSVSPSMMFEEAEVSTTGLQGAINKLAEFLHPVYEAISGIPQGVDAALTVAASLFEQSPERFREGMNKFQQLFKENETLRAIAVWAAGASTDVTTFFENAWLNIKKGALEAAKTILTAFKPILEALGFDVETTQKVIDTAIKKINKELDFNTNKVKIAKQAYEEWASGKLSTAGWTIVQNAISGCFGKGTKTVELFYSTVKAMEKHGYNPDQLTYGVQKGMTAGQKAQVVYQNFQKLIKKMSEDPVSFANLKKEFEALGIKIGNTKAKTDDGKKSIENYGKANIDTTNVQNQINKVGTSAKNTSGNIKTAETNVKNYGKVQIDTSPQFKQIDKVAAAGKGSSTQIKDLQKKLNILNGIKLDETGNVTQLGNVKTEGYYASGNVKNVKTSLGELNKAKINGGGIKTFFTNFGSWISPVLEGLTGILSGLFGIDQYAVTNTVTGKTTKKGNKNFTGGGGGTSFAKGGIVPRFDSGGMGINSASVFLAHENGIPEMVGRIGNRTAVANTQQMVSAMAQGVYEAMMEVMSASSGQNEVNVYIDGERIARAVDRANRIANRRFNVGLV